MTLLTRIIVGFSSLLPIALPAQAASLFGGIYAIKCPMYNGTPKCVYTGSNEKSVKHSWIDDEGLPLGNVQTPVSRASARITVSELSGDISRLVFTIKERGESPRSQSIEIPGFIYDNFKGSALTEFVDIPPNIDGDDTGYSQVFAIAGVTDKDSFEVMSRFREKIMKLAIKRTLKANQDGCGC